MAHEMTVEKRHSFNDRVREVHDRCPQAVSDTSSCAGGPVDSQWNMYLRKVAQHRLLRQDWHDEQKCIHDEDRGFHNPYSKSVALALTRRNKFWNTREFFVFFVAQA